MTSEEFVLKWLRENPNIIHIPSQHELGLMEAYAESQNKESIKNMERVIREQKETIDLFRLQSKNLAGALKAIAGLTGDEESPLLKGLHEIAHKILKP
jgi:predicted metallo-beta-lactamase superfamily hydrolase